MRCSNSLYLRVFVSLLRSSQTTKAKFYAVAKGRQTGVYTTWDECMKQVTGFKGAVNASFNSEAAAKKFIKEYSESFGIPPSPEDNFQATLIDGNKFFIDADGYIVVYTDGSYRYNTETPKGGIGVFFSTSNDLNVSRQCENASCAFDAEIEAVFCALDTARNCGFRKVSVYTDAHSIVKVATKVMSNFQNDDLSTLDAQKLRQRNRISLLLKKFQDMDIKWNNIYRRENQEADKLAKQASEPESA